MVWIWHWWGTWRNHHQFLNSSFPTAFHLEEAITQVWHSKFFTSICGPAILSDMHKKNIRSINIPAVLKNYHKSSSFLRFHSLHDLQQTYPVGEIQCFSRAAEALPTLKKLASMQLHQYRARCLTVERALLSFQEWILNIDLSEGKTMNKANIDFTDITCFLLNG